MDGIDAVLIDISQDQRVSIIATHSHAIPGALLTALQAAYSDEQGLSIKQYGELDGLLGEIFAEACLKLLTNTNYSAQQVSAIGSHGQTLLHSPGSSPAFTLQAGDPNIIAARTGINCIADFRRRDMAVGGQGAPLVPAFHNALFQSTKHSRVIANIGGIANLTLLPSDPTHPVRGFDTGPGNSLLDTWHLLNNHKAFDRDAQWGRTGKVIPELLATWLTDAYFQALPPKSTGREYFNLQWLQASITGHSAKDIQRTLNQLTIETIATAIETYATMYSELYVCGGGAHNPLIMLGLAERLPSMKVSTSNELGIDPDWVEAVAFAWLAHQHLQGLPGNLPSVTGASSAVVLGGFYPA